MFIGLKKQSTIKTSEKKQVLNPYQHIEMVLWVDALVSGCYENHPDNFVYIDIGDSDYTISLLTKVYPKARFHHYPLHYLDVQRGLKALTQEVAPNSVHYIYLGNLLSFCKPSDRNNIYEFIQTKLAPGGYAIIPYEATTGWAEYRVVLDLLREITLNAVDPIETTWLDKIFYELSALSLKKIAAFKSKDFLDKLLMYLKSLDSKHLQKVLKCSELHTFYPYQIHNTLNQDSDSSVRFVGSLPVGRNYVKLGLDSDQKAFLGEQSDLMMASQRQDLMLMPFQRVDVWQKPSKNTESKGSIKDFYLGVISDFSHFSSKITKGHLTLNFGDIVYTEIRKRLNTGFIPIQEIVHDMKHLVRSPQEIVDRLMLLVIGDQVRYALKPPKFQQKHHKTLTPFKKLKFCHTENQKMFSDIKRFYTEMGIVIVPNTGMMIPFDQKTSMVIAALTKVHETLVPQYCTEVWVEYGKVDTDVLAVQKEFQGILLFFKRHYFGKFLELGLLDRVLVD